MNEVYNNIENHIPDLRRYARSLVHDQATMEDLVQDSVMRALAKSHLYQSGTNLRAWLFTILHNQFISDIRQRSRFGVTLDIEDVAGQLATRADSESRVLLHAVEQAMGELPENQRELIELVALEGGSYADAAAACHLPLGTVKSRVSRARSRLRDRLDGQFERSAGSRERAGDTRARVNGKRDRRR